MLANGADNSAVRSFQALRTFLVNFQNIWLIDGVLVIY